ncbi:MAG: nucleotide-binding protein [Candidatus Cloacimonetes bacterium]|nr:nucleotide-binding protein [Candidatus Cloacimonadota bacterium]
MENIEPTILIQKFRLAHSTGVRALNDFSKKHLRSRYLTRAKNSLQALYGYKAPIVRKYSDASRSFRNITEDEYTALFAEFEHILNYLEFMSGQETANAMSQPSVPPAGNNVFIIHGHDEMNKLRLRDLLQNYFGLNPSLMKSEPGMSRSLLEKFEQSASACALAFAIITPDDEIINHAQSYCQARPNVIFEAGWFVGRLGIPRVCLLLKNGTTVHSDIDGISRIHFNDNIEDKVIEIQRELEAVGILNKPNYNSK